MADPYGWPYLDTLQPSSVCTHATRHSIGFQINTWGYRIFMSFWCRPHHPSQMPETLSVVYNLFFFFFFWFHQWAHLSHQARMNLASGVRAWKYRVWEIHLHLHNAHPHHKYSFLYATWFQGHVTPAHIFQHTVLCLISSSVCSGKPVARVGGLYFYIYAWACDTLQACQSFSEQDIQHWAKHALAYLLYRRKTPCPLQIPILLI